MWKGYGLKLRNLRNLILFFVLILIMFYLGILNVLVIGLEVRNDVKNLLKKLMWV